MAMRIVQHMALLLVLLCSGVAAQSSDSCTSALISLSPCLNYITGNETNPSSSCCSQLASVVKAEPKCLCMVLNGGTSSVGITVNQTQAMALPGACGVQTPPVSLCNSSGAPTGSPAPPLPTTPPSPTTPSSSSSSPSGGGSKAGPSADNTSGGCYTSVPASIFSHLLLFVAASIICFSSAKLI